MNPIRFHPEAEAEMNAAATWYEDQQDGLGGRFLVAVQDALARIAVSPLLFPRVEGDVHRCPTRIFPFGVLFRIKPEAIVIQAVMHLHREPGYWMHRGFERGN